jgi:hypothetical protein
MGSSNCCPGSLGGCSARDAAQDWGSEHDGKCARGQKHRRRIEYFRKRGDPRKAKDQIIASSPEQLCTGSFGDAQLGQRKSTAEKSKAKHNTMAAHERQRCSALDAVCE